MDVGEDVEVLVLTKRGREPEWVPAVVTIVAEDRLEVMFEGGSKQRFDPGTDRIRPKGSAEEGEEWVFWTS